MITDEYIQFKSFFLSKKRFYTQIQSIGILPGYGRFLIPGVSGFVISTYSEDSLLAQNFRFVGCQYPHELTKLFVNAALEKNPSIEISKSLLRSYGQPPYVISPQIMQKIKGKTLPNT